ncbi:hypothetical protein BHM03_00045640 [Ensete ventricosum]|nr:hypothetical protein BHM03_00045640 [Ensete ventricosum]
MLQIREGSCRIEISWHANSIGVSVKENRKKQERTQTERTIEIDLRGQSGAKEKNEGLVVGVLAEEATEMVGKEAGGLSSLFQLTFTAALPSSRRTPSSFPAPVAGHHLPFSSSTASAVASLALSCNHRWALLMLTPQPPSLALDHRPAQPRRHCPFPRLLLSLLPTIAAGHPCSRCSSFPPLLHHRRTTAATTAPLCSARTFLPLPLQLPQPPSQLHSATEATFVPSLFSSRHHYLFSCCCCPRCRCRFKTHPCFALLLNRYRQPLFSIGNNISHSPCYPPTTRHF